MWWIGKKSCSCFTYEENGTILAEIRIWKDNWRNKKIKLKSTTS
jgi:hypothetical protein